MNKSNVIKIVGTALTIALGILAYDFIKARIKK